MKVIVKFALVILLAFMVCAATVSSASAIEIEVAAELLNAGAGLPSYRAGDTFRIVGGVQLNATGWAALRRASAAFALVLDNRQTSIPENAMNNALEPNANALTSITGEHVREVGRRAFFGSISLVRVNFPSLTTIGDEAFYICASLESITLSGVTSLGRNAFRGCRSLTQVSMPDLVIVPEGAFANCTALANLYLPSARTIGRNAFENNSSLAVISLPAATVVELGAFSMASSVTELSLPSVTRIESGAFSGCTALRIIRLGDADPSVAQDAFVGVGRVTIYSNRNSLTYRANFPPHDLSISGDSSSSGCNAGLHLWAILLCAAFFLKTKRG